MLWLGVHFPLLPLEVFEQAPKSVNGNRAPESAPTVITDARGRIILRNAAAVAAGIVHGSTLATAHSIVPGLVHYRRSRERERERLALLAGALYGFSSRVSLTPPAADDADASAGIMLEIGGSRKLFGDAAELAHRVEAVCRGMGHELRVRWAATPLAALILARAEAASLAEVLLVHAAVEPERLTAECIERFANMGIHTLGRLLDLPRRGLTRRFGADLADYLDRLTGDKPDPRPTLRPAERFRATLHLLEPLNGKEALTFPMQRLLGDLQHWLVARELGTERLCWTFTGSGGGGAASGHAASGRADRAPSRTRLTVRFTRARQSREAFLDITRLELAEATLPEDVMSLSLEARRLTPWAAVSRSGGLFAEPSGPSATEAATEPGVLVDQLRARLGESACYSLEADDHHTPELAWQRIPPLLRSREPRGCVPLRRRPLWLFDPPRPVDRRQLELLEGPERIHTGWWLTANGHAPPGQARDYYVARHHSGARCWVFADPWERWYLHGYFA